MIEGLLLLARGSLLVLVLALLGTTMLSSLIVNAGEAIIFRLPGHPVAASVYDQGNASAMLVSISKPGGEELVRVLGGRHQGWYRLVLGNVSFSAYKALFLRGDELCIYGAYGVVRPWFYELMPVLVIVSLEDGQGIVETMAILGNMSLRIVPIGMSPGPSRQPYVLYAANILGKSTSSSSDVLVPEGLLLARIRLGEKPGVSSFFFPARNTLFTAWLVAGKAVYVAGTRVGEVKEVAESLPSNTTILVGVVHGDAMILHEYRVPGCSLPYNIYDFNNTLYLSCTGGHDFSLVLLAIDPATWKPLWSASYNASTMVFGVENTSLTGVNNRLYVPITNGLVVIDPETGKPLKAITLATISTRSGPGLVGITTAHILGEPYVVVVNYDSNTITWIPLRLLENTKCIQAGDIALGETKLAWTRLKPLSLGVEKVRGRQLPLTLTKIAIISIEKYNNATEKHLEITRPRDCKPLQSRLESIKIVLKTTILTIKNANTWTSTTTPAQYWQKTMNNHPAGSTSTRASKAASTTMWNNTTKTKVNKGNAGETLLAIAAIIVALTALIALQRTKHA